MMRRAYAIHLCVTLALIGGMLITGLFGARTAQRAHTYNAYSTREHLVVPPIRGPEDYISQGCPPEGCGSTRFEPTTPATPFESTTSVKAVAIVGKVTGYTDSLIAEMNNAVNALETYGATVETFFYGEETFSWSDIVTASLNANFLLYMGHGVYYGGECANPTEVGGFSLGYGPIVTPDDIRQDLAGRIDRDAVVILSHACFSAGDTACDPEGWPSQAEAERRVRMYAAPFVDIGMQAYYANNYNNSMTHYIYELLAPVGERASVGQIFKTIFPYSASDFRDLDYPDAPAYDLWLSGNPGHFGNAFVGIPDYTFQKEMLPEFGPLPTAIDLTYDAGTETFTSGNDTLTIENIGSSDALNWEVTQAGNWFTPTPSEGQAPDDPTVTLAPNTGVLLGLGEGQYTGAVTVTITDPPETEPRSQRVDLSVVVEGPRLGDLADTINFVYFPEVESLIPEVYSLQPQNTGTGDALTWDVAYAGDWFTVSPSSGSTPAAFAVDPDTITGQTAITGTGVVTVTVTDPPNTFNGVQVITVNLSSSEGEPSRVYLPAVAR